MDVLIPIDEVKALVEQANKAGRNGRVFRLVGYQPPTSASQRKGITIVDLRQPDTAGSDR